MCRLGEDTVSCDSYLLYLSPRENFWEEVQDRGLHAYRGASHSSEIGHMGCSGSRLPPRQSAESLKRLGLPPSSQQQLQGPQPKREPRPDELQHSELQE